MKAIGDRMDARFDSMEKKFDDRFGGIDEKLVDVGKKIDLCATKEQFTLLENSIAGISGRLLQIENNMKMFVVREELKIFQTKEEVSEQIDAKLKGKRVGGLAVADEGQEYSAQNS
jgi:hypothetical protein